MKHMKKNTKNVTVFLGVLMMGLTLFTLEAVAQTAQSQQSAEATQSETDENGCVFSNGYMYSVVLAECIRPSEKGVAMISVEKGKAVKAFVVRNPQEKAAEVFLPGKKEGKVFGMDVEAQVPTWRVENFVLVNDPKKGWILSQEEKVLFASKV